jgi:hypothetical protein
MSEQPIARLLSARKTSEGLYEVEIEVRLGEKGGIIKTKKIIREPARATARISGDYVLIELGDKDGKPIATCCIHRGHIEKGCLDCPSLIHPPK